MRWGDLAPVSGVCCFAQAKNPSRDLPIAILGSLSVATILYILMALAITMMVSMHSIHLTAEHTSMGRQGATRLGHTVGAGPPACSPLVYNALKILASEGRVL